MLSEVEPWKVGMELANYYSKNIKIGAENYE